MHVLLRHLRDVQRRRKRFDRTLAPHGVPDLSWLPGYSLDDVRYNCVGLQSPAQAREATKSWHGLLVGLGVLDAFVALWLATPGPPLTFIALIVIGVGGCKVVIDWQEIRAGHVSHVDGDIWTELRRDGEGGVSISMHIDDLRLEITRQAYLVLRDGGPYRIYYLPHAKRAVGGQVLPAWRPSLRPRPTKRRWPLLRRSSLRHQTAGGKVR